MGAVGNSTDLTWATPAALAWLQTILSERWGGAWALTREHPDALTLRPATGSDSALRFGGGIFPRGTSKLPCGKWRVAAPWRGALFDDLPMPGLERVSGDLISQDENGWWIRYNIPGLVFWALSRSEELRRSDLDEFGRFAATSSHARSHGYLQRPVVDEWLYVLAQVGETIWPGAIRFVARPELALSHDVDHPGRYAFASWPRLLRRMAGDLLLRREPVNMLKAPLVRLSSTQCLSSLDPNNQFAWMMDVAEAAGVRAAFYFICGHTNAVFDGDYDLEHPAIRALLLEVHARGHEIGLHPSFETYRDPDELAAEAQRLRAVCEEMGIAQSVWGGRMHYLRWANPDTLRAWAQAGMTYDATLGYADEPGFRCGTCMEFPAFDVLADSTLPLRLRPLVAMETTVMEPSNLGLGTGPKAAELLRGLKECCAAVGGTFSLLWHNSSLTRPDQRSLYHYVVGA